MLVVNAGARNFVSLRRDSVKGTEQTVADVEEKEARKTM